MAENSGVVFLGQNKVEVQSIDFPKMQNPAGKKINHGVILKSCLHQHLRLRSAHGPGPHYRPHRHGSRPRDHR